MSLDEFLLSADTTDLNYPEIRPTLDLNFARTKTLDPRITFRRSSGGSYFGPDGRLRYAGVNEPRFDHNPTTGESLGLLVEEQRTNSIRNNTMVGAVAGTPGTLPTNWTTTIPAGLSREIIGVGSEAGVTYLDIKVSGTASAAGQIFISPEPTTAIVAASGQSWTGSWFLSLAGGSITSSGLSSSRIDIVGRDAGGGTLETTALSYTPSSGALALTRQYVSRTLSNAGTLRVSTAFRVDVANDSVVDFTLRIGLPQLEQGAFATSVIPTSGTAATRSADVASISGSAFSGWYRQDEGCVYAEWLSTGANSFANVYQFHNNAPTVNLIEVYRANSDAAITARIREAGGTQQTLAFTSQQWLNKANKIATSYAVDDYHGSINGGALLSDTSLSLPTASVLSLGNAQAGASANCLSGTIKRLSYWPQRLPNTILQALTR